MRFLADENFSRALVAALEADGHDIAWVRLAIPGAKDPEVLEMAVREGRVLLTFDKDFGELAAHSALPSGCGVILFRIPAPNSDAARQRVVAQIGSRDDWSGHFSVVEPGRVRLRPLR